MAALIIAPSLRFQNPNIGFLNKIIDIGSSNGPKQVRSQPGFMGLNFGFEPKRCFSIEGWHSESVKTFVSIILVSKD